MRPAVLPNTAFATTPELLFQFRCTSILSLFRLNSPLKTFLTRARSYVTLEPAVQ